MEQRIPVTKALSQLCAADDATDAALTVGLRDPLFRFAELFDQVWESDPTFRERWKPRKTRMSQIFSGHYLDKRLHETARKAEIKIARQLSEHGGHWDFLGATRYKPPKGGRSLKLRRAFEPGSASQCRVCIGTQNEHYSKGEGTYSIAELIISAEGELLLLERDVTGGARHLRAYYVDGIASRGASSDERVTSPDIMDARIFRNTADGKWEHRTGSIRVHRTWLRTGYTTSWRDRAPWLDGNPESGIVVAPPALHRDEEHG